jgi:selenocysteine lyase/cysteine desulfurase
MVEYADNVKRMPILSFSVKNIHNNLIVVLLNDIFGIQIRGGKMCAGILNDHFKIYTTTTDFAGCHFTGQWQNRYNIQNAIEYVIDHCDTFKHYYNDNDNLFFMKDNYKRSWGGLLNRADV